MISLLLLSLSIAHASAQAAGPIQGTDCPYFYRLIAPIVENGNTTTLRQEKKWVVTQGELDKFMSSLRTDFGEVPLRDTPAPGTVNVTITDYARDVVLGRNADGKKLSAKIRVRRYGSRPENGSPDDITIGEQYRTRSKVEFKIQHPEHDGVVFKPGIVMENADIDLLLGGKDSFYANIAEVRKRTQALAKPDGQGGTKLVNADSREVDEMFDAMRSLYDDMSRPGSLGEFPEGLNRIHRVRYERDAYQLDVPDLLSGKKIKVQITVDRNVNFFHPAAPDEAISSYPADWRVIEVKIPLQYSIMSDEQLGKAAPKLLELRRHTQALKQVADMPEGKGKAGGSKLIIRDKLEREGIALNEDDVADMFRNAEGYLPPGTLGEIKHTLKLTLMEKPVSDYFPTHGQELRRIRDTVINRPIPTKEGLAALRDDINTLVDLHFNELSRMKQRGVLSEDGKKYFELLKAFKTFNRKYQNSWLTHVIQEHYSAFISAKPGNYTVDDLYRSIIDQFVFEQGALIKTDIALKERLRKWIEPREWAKRRRAVTDFARERAAKTYMSHLVAIPLNIGGLMGYAALCAHMEWKCPIVNQTPNPEKRSQARESWKESREKITTLHAELQAMQGRLKDDLPAGDDAAERWRSTAPKIRELGLRYQQAMDPVILKDQHLADEMKLEVSNAQRIFQVAKTNLQEAKRAHAEALKAKKPRNAELERRAEAVAAREEEYAIALAGLAAMDIFLPKFRGLEEISEKDFAPLSNFTSFNRHFTDSLQSVTTNVGRFINQADKELWK
ncbi:MAG: hypothetical protein NDJ89_07475 [Oligoflexia bacterium]|nr:hypothetical protein [Oligoflexia bacterium]